MATVLLTDPEQRAALAAARSLARAGHRVLTLGVQRGLAGVSRSVRHHVFLDPAVARQADAIREVVSATVREHSVQVVIPVTDFASRALLGYDAELGAPVAGPSAAAYARASDKALLLSLAAEIGIRVPRQEVLERYGDRLISSHGSVVVKPARSEVAVQGKSQKLGVSFAANRQEAERVISGYPEAAYPLLVQERTIGDGVGVFLLRSEGSTALAFAHRRLREKPPAGGVSTYRESIAVPPDLRTLCESLLDRLEYSGAAMLEFKQDRQSGEYVLMEINARLWGSLQLAVDAGVDFPTALVASSLGEARPASTPQIGVRSAWEFGEIDHALALLRGSEAGLHLPTGTKVGLSAALDSLLSRRWTDRAEVFRWTDPAPFVMEAWLWLHAVTKHHTSTESASHGHN